LWWGSHYAAEAEGFAEGVAIGEGGEVHGLFSLGLDGEDGERAGSAGDGTIGEDRAAFFGGVRGAIVSEAFEDGGLGSHFAIGCEEFDLDAGPGAEAADAGADFGGGAGPIDPGDVAVEFGGSGGEGGVLFEAGFGSGGEGIEDAGEKGGAEIGEAIVEFAGGFAGFDGGGGGGEDVASVHDAGDRDDADTGEWVVIEDGPVDRCGAAVAWEEAGVEVDAAAGSDGEEFVGEFLAEGDDDEAFGLECAEQRENVGGVGILGAGEGEAAGEGPGADGGGGEGFAAAGGAIRLGNDVEDFVMRGGQGQQ